ncbi:DNA processing protein DprA [Leptospira langatensis]|uniref:DNA processing protein DprA n=1 Tax=Leptospira langatensis TaxID=2484983 RepID=A0A5F1ZXN9_9LEPT|nr:DNA-processing protein DprA [Leptospira langatensis]TGK01203.1 DNA processing protein DprA [Leptospira langatensis]TGL42347.1 DNA processing protein DprA [Leptospira langatensis]
MDFLALTSPNIYRILTRSRILASSSSKQEVLEKIGAILPKDLKERANFDSKTYSESARTLGVSILDYFDPHYPALLKEIYDPPPNLFCIGNLSVLDKAYVSVVGTRKISAITFAYSKAIPSFIRSLGCDGLVSGLALGVDAIAMHHALAQGLFVIGVMGTGPETEYPYANKDLYRKMKRSANALILTECPPGFQVRKYAFPKRNRIITGISSSLLIMEAPNKSGALSSASSAISQNREIYVFDHPYQFSNEGGRKLISEGANRVLFPEDQGEETKIFHTNEIIPDRFEEVPGMLAQLGKQRLNGNWIDLGNGFIRSIGNGN